MSSPQPTTSMPSPTPSTAASTDTNSDTNTSAWQALPCRIAALHLHPVKSCRGLLVDEALMIETGLELDRAFMVVDAQGRMLTQRRWPRMALVTGRIKNDDLILRAPGMLALHVRLDAVEQPARATVWRDEVAAYDMGGLAAQWFSDFLGVTARLVRYDPQAGRVSNPQWAGPALRRHATLSGGADKAPGKAEVAFADGYAASICCLESLGDLNERLLQAGHEKVTLERFRPNIVLEGLEPFMEDHVKELHISTAEGTVKLALVKPCERCEIPNIDPETAEVGSAVNQALAQFRSDPRMGGAITFGMNAIVLDGIDHLLKVGQQAQAFVAF